MHVMAGFTLSLLEGEMDITLGEGFSKLFMTFITEVRDFTLETHLSINKTAQTQNH
jgi:hypothetical protein